MIKQRSVFEKEYYGDIEGTTSYLSNEPDYFGVSGIRPRLIKYEYKQEDLRKVEDGIDMLNNRLRIYKRLLNKFIQARPNFTKKELATYLGISEHYADVVINDYKKLTLGLKIKECIEMKGKCEFEVELW